MDNKTANIIELCIQKFGNKKLNQILNDLLNEEGEEDNILTIIVNEGVHNLQDKFIRGEVFIASKGSLDFSNGDIIVKQYREILKKLAIKLKSKSWNKIYIIPFGPATLSMQIKLLVYRVTSIESIDVFHIGEGHRFDFELKQRDLIIESESI